MSRRPFIEKQIENTQIGDKTEFFVENLGVGPWVEMRVAGCPMGFWTNSFPEIQAFFRNFLKIFSQIKFGWDFQNFQNRFGDLLV